MAGSSLPRRALGRTLRNYRTRAGYKQSDAGAVLETSPQSVSRMEDGQRIKISTAQIKVLLDFYGMSEPNSERDEILSLWAEVRRHDQIAKAQGTGRGWWRSYSDQLDGHFDHYLSLEAAANRLTSHQLSLIPGLLQTTEYRRGLIQASELDLSAVNIERRLEFAARRRARLDEDDFWLDALLSEAVLRHHPGGPSVMADQLRWLAEVSEHMSVTVRVVPFNVDVNSGLLFHSFTLLEFPPVTSRSVEPPVVYLEGYEGALYLDQADSITRFRRAITSIERVALSENASRDLVWRIAKECTG
ncbi:helix-turn-helix domain-containing protein [Nocardia sp. NPDC059240]|uniref:helix-turn-helix domain-containing protein n=1 Tax=Nocardia sp. NPDC059240 TaxID=3346786 RepID=UPI00367BC3F5